MNHVSRWILLFAFLCGACAGVPKSVVQTATTSIDTQAQTAKTAAEACRQDGENRDAACDRVIQSFDQILETNAELKAQAQ